MCLRLKPDERITIITDSATREIAAALQQEVEKMRAQYKAPVADSDVPAIVAYLVNHKGLR